MLLIRFIIQIRLSQYTTNSLLAFQPGLNDHSVIPPAVKTPDSNFAGIKMPVVNMSAVKMPT